MVCSSPAHLRIVRTQGNTPGAVLFDANMPPPNPVAVSLGPLSPGQYVIHWSYIVAGPSWELVAELQVDGATRFRKYNTPANSIPTNTLSIILNVS
jgi:hypothetical protein